MSGETISVRIESGKGLKKANELFCLIKLGKEQRRSRDTKRKDGLFSWDELFQMKLESADDKVLVVEIVRHSIMKKHCLGQVSVDLNELKTDGPIWYPVTKKKDVTPVQRGELQITIDGLKKAKGKQLDLAAIEKEMGIDLSIPVSPHSTFDPTKHLDELKPGEARIKAGENDAGTLQLSSITLETGVIKYSFTKDSVIFDLILPRKLNWTKTYNQNPYCRANLAGIDSLKLRPCHRLQVTFETTDNSDIAVIHVEAKAISDENKNLISIKAVAKIEKARIEKVINEDELYEAPPQFIEGELLDAAQKGLPDKVRIFLDRGDDVNVKNENEETPLHKAVTNGNLEVIKMLIESGAEPMQVDKFGDSPVTLAEKYFKTELIPLLRTYQ